MNFWTELIFVVSVQKAIRLCSYIIIMQNNQFLENSNSSSSRFHQIAFLRNLYCAAGGVAPFLKMDLNTQINNFTPKRYPIMTYRTPNQSRGSYASKNTVTESLGALNLSHKFITFGKVSQNHRKVMISAMSDTWSSCKSKNMSRWHPVTVFFDRSR